MTDKLSPKITVAIPTYNREEFLRQALQSLDQQTMKDFIVILFDNNSSYDIAKLIAEFPDLFITLKKNATNIGNQANFAQVMSCTYNTPWVMIFHDDDTIHPNYFADAIKELHENSDTKWIGSLIKYIHPGQDMMEFAKGPNFPPSVRYSKTKLADAFMNNLAIGFSTVIYRKEVLLNTKPEVERFNKWLDRPFMLEACGNQAVLVLHYPYINYRLHVSQDSAQPYRENLTEMINLIDYLVHTGNLGKKSKLFATASAIKTATLNANSITDFFNFLQQFKERGLYRTRDLRLYSIAWFIWILFKRTRQFLLKR